MELPGHEDGVVRGRDGRRRLLVRADERGVRVVDREGQELGFAAHGPGGAYRREEGPGAERHLAHFVFDEWELWVRAVPAVQVRRPGALEERFEDRLWTARTVRGGQCAR